MTKISEDVSNFKFPIKHLTKKKTNFFSLVYQDKVCAVPSTTGFLNHSIKKKKIVYT